MNFTPNTQAVIILIAGVFCIIAGILSVDVFEFWLECRKDSIRKLDGDVRGKNVAQ